MPRWEHGSVERLKQAGLELFDEQGFHNTTAVQIAERARVTTRTFFRYFSDKEAIVFADADLLRASLVQEILDATDVTEPLQTVTQALAGFDWLSLGSREIQRQRDVMIASYPGLLERELYKQQQTADEIGAALLARGVAPDVAELAAHVGIQVFRVAYRQWLAADDNTDLPTTAAAVLAILATIAPTSSSRIA